ncbi:DUF1768 domain-containing protein [Photobacterium kishitanii]|uniref:NADAR family protein n=1 Tax=Photobacterium kishitanii TaxID=318456 RepID=UPI000D16417B|nr:NADAR family protein [Photobacterium kishitanii]PSU92021.1 DUF1768 domain-containing protein [Photobacterium kishitanii]
MLIQSNEELLTTLSSGETLEYLYFWGHRKPKSGEVTKSCFSQWYEAEFVENGLTFKTAEHYMMFSKAKLFKNEEIAKRILISELPSQVKQLGREVTGFKENVWNQHRYNIVCRANFLKFNQNKELLEYLKNSGSTILVEAGPVDTVWGVGLAADNIDIHDSRKWVGLNLLGYALMWVRKQLI